jgi:FHA domain/Cyclic nucleotide-binding domain
MLSTVPENKMHVVRWFLASGWALLILSAFYDPLSLILTDPNNLLSPLHIHAERCIQVQGVCLAQPSYALAPRIFWGIIVPLGVIILLVGGHEAWRRICPLYFFSQIPRRLGIQRKRQRTNAETGAVRQELVGVDAASWLGQNFAYLQFGLFFIGLNIRLLVANGSALGFGLFMVATVAAAIAVGWFYKGRSWCQYFCPMAPVQVFYTSNRGLLGSDAHLSPPASVTQSMCRTIDPNGKEKSACVSCQSPCLDIDAERTYWKNLDRPERKLLFYGYFGLMLGFFVYFYLYAGNWDYYYSGIWSHDVNQLSSLWQPGFFINHRAWPIPKILAAPLTLGTFTVLSYLSGLGLEKLLQSYRPKWNREQVRHISYVLMVFLSFNIFFVFAGRPNLRLLPDWVELLFNGFLIVVSTLWLQRNLPRSQSIYQKESLTGSLRRQLQKLAVNWADFLDGRPLEELGTNEVYVLAKVLPGFNRQSRLQVYQGVLQEALAEGKTQSANSLELLQDIRDELQITPEDHFDILNNLGVENPSLLDPNIQRSREDQLRLENYQRGLESLMLELIASHVPMEQALQQKQAQITAMRQEYSITTAEQEQVLLALFHPNSTLLNTSATLLHQLQQWVMRQKALTNLPPNPQAQVYQLLRSIALEQQQAIGMQLLNILEMLADDPLAQDIARTTGLLIQGIMHELLTRHKQQLSPEIRSILTTPAPIAPRHEIIPNPYGSLDITIANSTLSQLMQIDTQSSLSGSLSLTEVLQDLLQEIDPLIRAASLYGLEQIEPYFAENAAKQLDGHQEPIVQELIDSIFKRPLEIHQIPTITLDLSLHGHQEKRVFQQPVVRVGRATDNDLVILDNQVSRYHALFKIDATGFTVRDLGSANGLRLPQQNIRDREQAIADRTPIYFCPSDDIILTPHWSLTASNPQEEAVTIFQKLLWLRSSKFFQTLNRQSLLAMAQSSSLRIYNQNDVLCQQGEPATTLLLLISGTAHTNGQRITPGKIIGELNILTKTAYTETVVATSPKLPALAIDANSFETLLDREPQIARSLLVSMSQRLQTQP